MVYGILVYAYTFKHCLQSFSLFCYRFLLRFPEALQNKVAHCLADGLVKLMSTCESNSCDLNEANNVANTVASCFDNFPPGIQAISLCFPDTIFFLEKMMSECLMMLQYVWTQFITFLTGICFKKCELYSVIY